MSLVQSIKIGGMGALVAFLSLLPPPYVDFSANVFMAVGVTGLIATQIPAPAQGSLWRIPYAVLSFCAANWGQAVNYAFRIRGRHPPE